MQEPPGDIDRQDDMYVVIALPKCVAVFTRREFLDGLKRGKGWVRREAMDTQVKHLGKTNQAS